MIVLLATLIVLIAAIVITTIIMTKENAVKNSDPSTNGGLFKQLHLRTIPIERLRILWLNCTILGYNKDIQEREVLSKAVSNMSRDVLIEDISKLRESDVDNIYIAYCKSKDNIDGLLDTMSTEDKIHKMYKENFI
jgi:hypothetical protein